MMKQVALAILLLTFICSSSIFGQTVVFQSGFEYVTEPVVGVDAANLNGANGQVGLFSGILPTASGSFSPDLMGFKDHPGPNNLTRVLQLDRPNTDASFFAEFDQAISVDGATVSFEVGTRRTSGSFGDVKDYDIIGWDSAGSESFRVRISANSADDAFGQRERVAIVSNQGADILYDLPTVLGEDRDEDVESIGNVADVGEIARIELSLQSDGYVLDFENFIPAGGVRPANSYTTEMLPYNGSATEIARLEFTIKGHPDDNSFRGGHVLDNIFASGNVVPFGVDADFNDDGLFDCQDIDALVAEIVSGNHSAAFDLTNDGLVDGGDQVQWLADAASGNGLSSSYRLGDANLDGSVDVGDFNVWNNNKFTSTAAWCSGDFNHDGSVDVGDFNIWNNNKFTSSGTQAVPEPSTAVLLCGILIVFLGVRRSQI